MEATLEPRLVVQGEQGIPFLQGHFVIASYQRGYRWGRLEVRQLLDDIFSNIADASRSRRLPSDYYLQPIVVLKRGDSWELVDGQQRLTTLFLITKHIATKLPGVAVDYSLFYETRTGSREFLDDLDLGRRDENIDFHHIASAYDAIVAWFDEQANAVQAAIDIFSALSKWVYVIWYEAPSDVDPNELFVRLNRDRIPLTDSELIKALVLSNARDSSSTERQLEMAAQWDGIERSLRDEQFWTFLTGASTTRPTHIDFLFESMTPEVGGNEGPRHSTFLSVQAQIASMGRDAFWGEVVERHGLLTGWFEDRYLFHRVGYLVAIGLPIRAMIDAARARTHSAFRAWLHATTRDRLALTVSALSMLRYDDPRLAQQCTRVLLLMNVESSLQSTDPGSRFSFHAYAGQGWSLEHIHPQNAAALKTEEQRRDWIAAHRDKILRSPRTLAPDTDRDALVERMERHLAMPETRADEAGFDAIVSSVLVAFSASPSEHDEEMHGLKNLALLQRAFNSKLGNAVFALKRERILDLDAAGEHLLPCTRNVFLKYYTKSEDQQLSIWSPQDQEAYYDALLFAVRPFLLDDEHAAEELEAGATR